jgi:GWxTD domain-containing protein
VADALGWTVFHSLWEGVIVAIALAATLTAIRSPRARYGAACLAMLVMLGGFALTFVHEMPTNADNSRSASTPAFPPWRVVAGLEDSSPYHSGLARVVPWLAPLWIVGVWIFYLHHIAGWISVYRLRRRGVCSAPQRWQNNLALLAAELRVSRPVLLLESCLADVPMVLGHFRPVILMPVGLLAGLPAGQIEAILLHELAHIHRCDYLVNAWQRLAEGLLFYHPAVWWISRVIRAERENCCDDVVVALRGDPHGYAVALAVLEQNRCSGREPAVAASGGNLMKRIRRLLYPKGPNGAWTPFFATVILMASAAVALAAWQSEPLLAPQPETTAFPYTKWLNQDVVYLIADEERAAFEKLTTDEEREMFIQQFWSRRDPTPATAKNEFKDEYYRRIAFSNEHFRTVSGHPGWQTDRGHMYIVYGPPDTIAAGVGDSQTPQPSQIWTYRHVEGIGDDLSITFVDRSGKGDYRLAPGKTR